MAATPTTQRAYTLRLSGIDKDDNQWRQHLWRTHEAVNKGAKVFGDWLLTLRGGLSHTLAEEQLNGEKPTEEEIKNRRIILALSWLSVEDEQGAPDDKYIIASGNESRDARERKVIEAFQDILKSRKLTEEEIQSWMNTCEDALKANIREDAVWINRSKIFDEITNSTDENNARDDCRKIIWHIFGDNYLDLKKDSGSAGTGNRTRQMFTNLFGESSHKATPVLKVFWAGYLKGHFSSILQFNSS
jgi:hypothetical protein